MPRQVDVYTSGGFCPGYFGMAVMAVKVVLVLFVGVGVAVNIFIIASYQHFGGDDDE